MSNLILFKGKKNKKEQKRAMPNYQNSKIYKLVCDDPELIYYGSTTQILCKRFQRHKNDWKSCKKGICKSGLLFEEGNVKIELIEKFPCNDKDELNARESYFIKNNKCVNKMVPGRTQKEYYYDNRETRLKNNKTWRDENKERLSELMKEKIICECGTELSKSSLTVHKTSKKHKRLMELSKF